MPTHERTVSQVRVTKPALGALIIADDLTGAADTAVSFVSTRGPVVIPPAGMTNLPGQLKLAPVIAVNSNARAASDPHNANAATASALTSWMSRIDNSTIVYLKIDSLLRGWIKETIKAVQANFPSRTILLCPAFPAMNRYVVYGQLQASTNVTTAERYTGVLETLGLNTPAGEHFARQVYESQDSLDSAVSDAIDRGVSLISLDCCSEGHMSMLAHTFMRFRERLLPVGSGGLARAIARLVNLGFEHQPKTQSIDAKFSLTVVGSRHPIALEQATALASLTGVRAPSKSTIRAAMRLFAEERTNLIVFPRPDANPMDSAGIARLVDGADLVSTPGLKLIVATGGDTAAALLDGFVNQVILEVMGEVESGMPVCAVYTRYDSRSVQNIVLKSGSFGDRNTLISCIKDRLEYVRGVC